MPEFTSIKCENCKERVAKTVNGTSRVFARGAVIVKSAGVEIKCKCGHLVDVTNIFKGRHFIKLGKGHNIST